MKTLVSYQEEMDNIELVLRHSLYEKNILRSLTEKKVQKMYLFEKYSCKEAFDK